MRRLHDDALLDPVPKERPAHPAAGHALWPGDQALYEGHAATERICFDLSRFAHAIPFKAAYHRSPDRTRWHGMARLEAGLEKLRAHERRLRRAAAAQGPAGR